MVNKKIFIEIGEIKKMQEIVIDEVLRTTIIQGVFWGIAGYKICAWILWYVLPIGLLMGFK